VQGVDERVRAISHLTLRLHCVFVRMSEPLVSLKPSVFWRTRLPLSLLVLAVVVLLNAACEWPYAVRCVYPTFNSLLVAVCALAVPGCLVRLRSACTHRVLRLVLAGGVALFLPVSLVCLIAALFAPADSLQDSLQAQSGVYRVYMREPIGSISPPFTVLRKERDTGMGLRMVRTLWSSQQYGNARLVAIHNHLIELSIDDANVQVAVD
jgi:hypothetical protein